MLNPKFIPTPLVFERDRPPIHIIDPARAGGSRILFIFQEIAFLTFTIFWKRLRGKLDDQTLGRLLSGSFQRMGALWIKLGQLLSLRSDLLPRETCDELEKLQERAFGFPTELAIRQIEEDMKGPLREHFSEFHEQPFAAASIAQVHKARLRFEGCWVAVKVRRPGVEAVFASDLQLIKMAVALVIRLRIAPHMRWNSFVWEIDQLMREELDYRYEAANMRRMRKSLRPHRVYVPKLFTRYSSHRVLVMEFIDGALMTDVMKVARNDPVRLEEWIRTNNINRRRTARRLLHSQLRQTVEDNLFHCDLHPGNIFLLRNSRIGFVDFGSIGTTERDFLEKYISYQEALLSRHYSKAVDVILGWGDSVPRVDLSELRDQMVRLFQIWEGRTHVKKLDYNSKSIAAIGDRLTALLGQYKIPSAWGFLKLGRAMATMDAAVRELAGNANITKMQKAYYRKRDRRARKELTKGGDGVGKGAVAAVADLPKMLYETSVDRGAVIRRMSQNFGGPASKISRLAARVCSLLSFGVLILFFPLALLCLHQVFHRQEMKWLPASVIAAFDLFPTLDAQVWLIIFLLVAYFRASFFRLHKNFEREEVRVD